MQLKSIQQAFDRTLEVLKDPKKTTEEKAAACVAAQKAIEEFQKDTTESQRLKRVKKSLEKRLTKTQDIEDLQK